MPERGGTHIVTVTIARMQSQRERSVSPVVLSFCSESAQYDDKTDQFVFTVPQQGISQHTSGFKALSVQSMEMGMYQRAVEPEWCRLYMGEAIQINQRNRTLVCGDAEQHLPLTVNYVTSVHAHGPCLHVRTAFPHGLFCTQARGMRRMLDWLRLTVQTVANGIVEIELDRQSILTRLKLYDKHTFTIDVSRELLGEVCTPSRLDTPAEWSQCGVLYTAPLQCPEALAQLVTLVTRAVGGGTVTFDEEQMRFVQSGHSFPLQGDVATFMGLDGTIPSPYMSTIRTCELAHGDYGRYGSCQIANEWSAATNPFLFLGEEMLPILTVVVESTQHVIQIPPGNYSAVTLAEAMSMNGDSGITVDFVMETALDPTCGRFRVHNRLPFRIEFDLSPSLAKLMGFDAVTMRGETAYTSDRPVYTAMCPPDRRNHVDMVVNDVRAAGSTPGLGLSNNGETHHGGRVTTIETFSGANERSFRCPFATKCMARVDQSGRLSLCSHPAIDFIAFPEPGSGVFWGHDLQCTTRKSGCPLHTGMAPAQPMYVHFTGHAQPPVHMLCAQTVGDRLSMFPLAHDLHGAPIHLDNAPAPRCAQPITCAPVYHIQRCAVLPKCIKPRLVGLHGVLVGRQVVGKAPFDPDHPHVAFVQLSAAGTSFDSSACHICTRDGKTAPYHMKLIFHPPMRSGGDGGHPLVLSPNTPLRTIRLRVLNEDLTTYAMNDRHWSVTVVLIP